MRFYFPKLSNQNNLHIHAIWIQNLFSKPLIGLNKNLETKNMHQPTQKKNHKPQSHILQILKPFYFVKTIQKTSSKYLGASTNNSNQDLNNKTIFFKIKTKNIITLKQV